MIIRLFCIPYAGGSSQIFSSWKDRLTKEIEVVPIELAGRGTRFHDPLYNNLAEAVCDVYAHLRDHVQEGPYAIFGHSLGAWIAHELYFKLKEHGHRPPEYIFFSGNRAPHLKCPKVLHKLSFRGFLDEIMRLGGTPQEFLDNSELLKTYVPILRADYKLAETYEYSRYGERINSKIAILHGLEDDIAVEEVYPWREYAAKEAQLFLFSGGHFFINTHQEAVLEVVQKLILPKAIIPLTVKR